MKFRLRAGGRFVIVMSAVVLHTTLSLQAQDFDRYRPNPPVPRATVPELPTPPDNPVEGSTEELVKALKGIMILDHESRVQDPIKPFDGIRIDPAADLTVAREAAFKETIQPYLGQPISIRMLNEMARNIVLLYRDCKQPVVDVSMPPGQDITDGIVQVVVTESRIGDIEFRGNCWFDDCILQEQNWLRRGQRIYEPCLQEELVWFNQNPFRDVGVELEPGDQPGTTDIIYKVQDEKPVRWYAGYEDSGVRTTGRERLIFGVNWGNAFGKDRQLSYQYSTAAQGGGILGVHSVIYQVPIFENRDNFTLFGSWADIDVPLGALNNNAEAWQISGRYRHTLCRTKCQIDTLQFGFDTKGTNSDLDFGGVTVLQQNVEVVNFMAGFSSQQQYCDGATTYALDVFASPSRLLFHNTSADFSGLRPDTKAYYIYARGYIERLYEIDCRSDLVVRLTGQIANDRLLPTEQLGIGGYNTVRGYDMRTVNGDNGYFANLEYRKKPIMGCCNGKQTSLTLLTFADFGQPFNRDHLPSEFNGQILSSVGVGFRYLVDPNCTIRFDYGYPLSNPQSVSSLTGVSNHNNNGRIHLGAVFAY